MVKGKGVNARGGTGRGGGTRSGAGNAGHRSKGASKSGYNPNWPSRTDNPSGRGRGNNPPKKQS